MKRLALALACTLLLAGCGSHAKPTATTAALSGTPARVTAVATVAAASRTPLGATPVAAAASPDAVSPPAATPDASAAQACSQSEAAQADAALQPFIAEVDSDVTSATNTARNALAGPIGQMQTTRQRLDSLKLPACAVTAVQAFDNYLDARITEFLDFQKAAPSAQVSQDDQTAVGLQQPVVSELAALQSRSGVAAASATPAR